MAAAPAGKPATYTLMAGQFLQITQTAELTGSPIQSNQPVAVFGASAGMAVPLGQADIDSAQQQLPPVRALGHEYVAVRYRGRAGGQDESVPWRIVGAVDGTMLRWEPKAPAGAPTALGLGDVVEIRAPGPFVVESQGRRSPVLPRRLHDRRRPAGRRPVRRRGRSGLGYVIAPAQYLDHYVLFTDPSYSETNLVLVRAPSLVDGSFADVMLSCAGASGPQKVTGWTPIGAYEYTRVDLVTGAFQSVGGCSNGRQEILERAAVRRHGLGLGDGRGADAERVLRVPRRRRLPADQRRGRPPHRELAPEDTPMLSAPRRAAVAACALLPLSLAAAAARAQTTTFAVDRLVMAGAPGDGIAVWRPEMSTETRFFGQLGLGYALNPLRVDNYVHNLNDAAKIEGNPLTSQLMGYADVGAEILGRVSLQVAFPFVAYQAGNPTNNAAANLPQPSVDLKQAAPGDLRVEARAIVFRTSDRSFKLGLSAAAYVPTGNRYSFAGDNGAGAAFGLGAEYDARVVFVTLNAAYRLRPTVALDEIRRVERGPLRARRLRPALAGEDPRRRRALRWLRRELEQAARAQRAALGAEQHRQGRHGPARVDAERQGVLHAEAAGVRRARRRHAPRRRLRARLSRRRRPRRFVRRV